jgi:dCMP deaminase
MALGKWDIRFIQLAHLVKEWSKDPSTKCGCVLVRDRRILATGYNGLPAGLSDDLSLLNNREYKLNVVIHAEKNAIFNAAKNGASTEGAIAYVNFHPCSQCASALIQAGVVRVICPNPNTAPERWLSNFLVARDLLFEAGVRHTYYSEGDL